MNILHFVNKNTLDTGVSSDIIDMPFTDHPVVLMNIVSEYIKHGSGYWKLNDSLLKDIDYVNGVNKSALMAQWLRDHAIPGELEHIYIPSKNQDLPIMQSSQEALRNHSLHQ